MVRFTAPNSENSSSRLAEIGPLISKHDSSSYGILSIDSSQRLGNSNSSGLDSYEQVEQAVNQLQSQASTTHSSLEDTPDAVRSGRSNQQADSDADALTGFAKDDSLLSDPDGELVPLNSSFTALGSVMIETQGIQGVIQRLTGNHMPIIGERTPGGITEPVQTTVWIFTGQIPSYGSTRWAVSDARQHSRLVKQVESDASGQFSVELPPNKYTVMAQYGDDLYLNAFLGNGSYATVQVAIGQVVEVLLDNTESAAF